MDATCFTQNGNIAEARLDKVTSDWAQGKIFVFVSNELAQKDGQAAKLPQGWCFNSADYYANLQDLPRRK